MNTELTEMTALTEREQKLALMTAQATTQGMMQMLAPMLNGMQQMTQMMAQTVQQMCTMRRAWQACTRRSSTACRLRAHRRAC